MSRRENAPTTRALARIMAEMIDSSSSPAAPAIGSLLHHRRNIEAALKRDCKADFFNNIAPIATTYS